jgi:NAD(P)-dependent dehydrogenase (short-subunit alcohol dehydrogenase family)
MADQRGAGQAYQEIIVTGASGGLGGALIERCLKRASVRKVWAVCRRRPSFGWAIDPRVEHVATDLRDPNAPRALGERLEAGEAAPDLVVQAAGLLHDRAAGVAPEKRLEQVTLASLQQSFAVNAFAPILLVSEILPALRRARAPKIVHVSARVGSVEDNQLGGWYGYRASKAAQNQLTRTLAIELKRRLPAATVIAYHPGTVDTELSAPFASTVDEGRLLSPERAAGHLLDVVDPLGPADSGRFFAWDGSTLPW